MKKLILYCLLAVWVVSGCGEREKQSSTLESLCDAAWMDLGILGQYPETPFLNVLMYDINHDGVQEAIVTHRGGWNCGSGYDGWMWSVYQFTKGRWQRKAEVEAGDFHTLTEEGQKPKLIATWRSWGKEDDGVSISQGASLITFEDDGVLKVIPFPELTGDWFSRHDGDDKEDDSAEPQLKSPNATLETIPWEKLHVCYPIGKTVIWKHGKSKYPQLSLANHYTWPLPVTGFFKPNVVMTNTATLLYHLQGAIIAKRSEVWWEHRRTPMVPEAIEMFTLDLEGQGKPSFFVNTGLFSSEFDAYCYIILRQTGSTTYSEIGHFRKDFTRLALHEKINGLHAIECRYPSGYIFQKDDFHARELYVFDGKRYNIAMRSWHKNDKTDSETKERNYSGIGKSSRSLLEEYPFEATYVVQDEEDVYGIAVKTGLSPRVLREFNGLTDSTLQAGQALRIPLREPPPITP